MSDLDRLINSLLSRSIERTTFTSMKAWFEDFNKQTRCFVKPIDRAILGGRLSLNVGFAFTSGYQSAIEALFKTNNIQLSSFCVTEEKGNHPRAIDTRLFSDRGKLYVTGSKHFVTGANESECLFIACRDEREGKGYDSEGKPVLKMVFIKTDIQSLEIQSMAALGFVPEVSHGKVTLRNVAISETQIFEGDGYLDYVKAFRSYEDLYILASLTAYRLGEALDGKWSKECIERHISLLLAIRSLSDMDLSQPAAHIGLAACRTQLLELIAETENVFKENNPNAFRCWVRDKQLLNIAKTAHQKRSLRAWSAFDHI